jgi:hypothetical protein
MNMSGTLVFVGAAVTALALCGCGTATSASSAGDPDRAVAVIVAGYDSAEHPDLTPCRSRRVTADARLSRSQRKRRLACRGHRPVRGR